jgi:hypothetical protein
VSVSASLFKSQLAIVIALGFGLYSHCLGPAALGIV